MKLVWILLCSSRLLFAWGTTGHEVIAEIAAKHLTGRANSEIKSILPDGETIASVSNWADEIKDSKDWANSDKWHYLDFPKDPVWEKITPAITANSVVAAIVRFEEVLRNKGSSAADKQAAVKFLVHLVGDVHQPLHVSTVKERGGSKTHVKFFGQERTPAGPKYNLHRVWDVDLIERYVAQQKWEGSKPKAYANQLDKGEIKEVVQWQEAHLMDWVKESYSFKDVAFGFQGGNIDEAYYTKAMIVINTRLLQSGYRLAKLFNDIFSGKEA